MAHTIQARKRIRQDEARNAANSARRSRLRTFVKNLEAAIDAKATDQIGKLFTAAMRELHQGAQKGVISKGAANRKISRLAARVQKSA